VQHNRVVPAAHRVVGPGTHRGSGPREVHTTVDPLSLTISLWMVRCTFEQLSLSFCKEILPERTREGFVSVREWILETNVISQHYPNQPWPHFEL
jgi:hypothetical protein